jgi:hypothetical protein
MKTNYIIASIVLLFSLSSLASPAPKCTKDMLEQVSNITMGFKPIVGNSLYVVERKTATIIIVRFYDSNKSDADPATTDLQAVFLKTKSECKLAALAMSPVDVSKFIDLLVE